MFKKQLIDNLIKQQYINNLYAEGINNIEGTPLDMVNVKQLKLALSKKKIMNN